MTMASDPLDRCAKLKLTVEEKEIVEFEEDVNQEKN